MVKSESDRFVNSALMAREESEGLSSSGGFGTKKALVVVAISMST